MPISPTELAERLQRLRESYAEKLSERVEDIATHLRPLIEGAWSDEDAGVAARLAHNLAGTGQTFGFPEVGTVARKLEDVLQIYRSPDQARPSDFREVLERHTLDLFAAARREGVRVSEVSFTPAV